MIQHCEHCGSKIRLAPGQGIVIENETDGDTIILHRACAMLMALDVREPAVSRQLVHALLGVIEDPGDLLEDPADEKETRQALRARARADKRVATVPQHPIGWTPENEEAAS